MEKERDLSLIVREAELCRAFGKIIHTDTVYYLFKIKIFKRTNVFTNDQLARNLQGRKSAIVDAITKMIKVED